MHQPITECVTESRLSRVLLGPLFLAGFLAVVLSAVSLASRPPTDEAIWAYGAWLWTTHDAPPYVAAFENKPVGIFLLYRLSQGLFGMSFAPVRVLNAAAVLATALLLYAAAKRYQGKVAGAMAGLIFGLAMMHQATDGSDRATTETFLTLFSTVAFFLLTSDRWNDAAQRRRILFAVGLALGAALCFKQVAVFDAIGLAPLCLGFSGRAKRTLRSAVSGMGLVLLGGAVVVALSVTPLLASGVSLGDYWSRSWGILSHQAAEMPFSERLAAFADAWFNVRFAILFLFVLLYIGNRGRLRRAGVPFWGLLFWLGIDFVGANAGNIFGHHMKQAMPSLALVAAMGIGASIEATAASMPGLRGVLFVSLVALWFPYAGVVGGVDRLLSPNRPTLVEQVERRQQRLAAYIDLQTVSSDPIYIWDTWSHAIHVYARRRSACRYFNTYLRFAPDFEATIAADLAERSPVLVVINQDILPPPRCVQDYVRRNCTPAGRLGSFSVFRAIDRKNGQYPSGVEL